MPLWNEVSYGEQGQLGTRRFYGSAADTGRPLALETKPCLPVIVRANQPWGRSSTTNAADNNTNNNVNGLGRSLQPFGGAHLCTTASFLLN